MRSDSRDAAGWEAHAIALAYAYAQALRLRPREQDRARQHARPAGPVDARGDRAALRDRGDGPPEPRSRRAWYRALNPFGQIPVIDDDGVVVTESGAILLYLARKSGTLSPADLAGEAQVL